MNEKKNRYCLVTPVFSVETTLRIEPVPQNSKSNGS